LIGTLFAIEITRKMLFKSVELGSILCSPRLNLFDQKYSNILKYYTI